MSVWAHNEQRRLVRIIHLRKFEESIVSQLFQENPTPQMDHPGSQQPFFNQNAQGVPLIHKDSMNIHSMETMLHFQQHQQ